MLNKKVWLLTCALTVVLLTELTAGSWTSYQCQGYLLPIVCPAGREIRINSGYYGRIRNDICPGGSRHNVNCRINAKSHMIKACNGKRKCYMYAYNAVFGNPCYLTDKYLIVNYDCVSADVKRHKEFICQGESTTLGCPHGKVLDIQRADYARWSEDVCPGGARRWYNCGESFLHKFARKCNHRQFCNVWSSNWVMLNPCALTFKYLQIEYYCR